MELNFDARTVEPNKALDPIPPDWYAVQIIGSEGKPTKEKDGGYLELTMEVVFGPYKGRKLFDRLNLDNKNKQTVEIAKGTLSAICHATGVIQMTNTQQLHGKPLLAKVVIRPAQGQYQAANEVKGYKAVEGGGQPAVGIGGNAQGVPTWAGGAQSAPATPTQSTPVAQSQSAPTNGGFSFGGGMGQQAQPANAGPAASETPSWAQPAQ